MAIARVEGDRTDRSIPIDVELQNISLSFRRPDGRQLSVFEDFNLGAEQGSFTILLGPSGCGKSTLLNVVDGLVQPSPGGNVRVLGQDIREHPDVTRQVAYVFQSPRLLPWLTLKKNVELALKGLKTQPPDQWDDLIEKYFSIAGLSDFLDYYPHEVSGGMQQRAGIVRAWINEPRILLMDEPFSHLDEITAGELRREMIELWMRDEPRRTILFVTHDITEAVQLGTDVVMLTPRPAKICYERVVELPWPRETIDDRVIDVERELRRAFASRAGVQV